MAPIRRPRAALPRVSILRPSRACEGSSPQRRLPKSLRKRIGGQACSKLPPAPAHIRARIPGTHPRGTSPCHCRSAHRFSFRPPKRVPCLVPGIRRRLQSTAQKAVLRIEVGHRRAFQGSDPTCFGNGTVSSCPDQSRAIEADAQLSPLKPIFSRTASGRRSSNRRCSSNTRRIDAMVVSMREKRSELARSVSRRSRSISRRSLRNDA